MCNDPQKALEESLEQIKNNLSVAEQNAGKSLDEIFTPEKIKKLQEALGKITEILTENLLQIIDVEWIEFLKYEANRKTVHRAFNSRREKVRKKNLSRLCREYKKFCRIQRQKEKFEHPFIKKTMNVPLDEEE